MAPHMTFGYCDGLLEERLPVPTVRFRATAVDLVISKSGVLGASTGGSLAIAMNWPLLLNLSGFSWRRLESQGCLA